MAPAAPWSIHEHELDPFSDGNVLKRGDILRLETGDGGGWDHPYDHEPELVMVDVLADFVSRAAALEDYGVVLSIDGESLDEEATSKRPENHPPVDGLFHRGSYRDILE